MIDVTKKIPVTRPGKALVQIAKSLSLCRGVISKAGSPGEESWGSILSSEKETRMRSSACQAVIPWLSNSDACGPCRTYHKRKVPASEKQDTITVIESGDEALLDAVMKRFNDNGEAGELGKLLKSKLSNTNVADPCERRWTPEMIQLCLFIVDKWTGNKTNELCRTNLWYRNFKTLL